jgi:predicted PurR-regulated permease PerM
MAADPTGVPRPLPPPPPGRSAPVPVREVDLDPRSVLVVMAALATLAAVTNLVRSAPRTTAALVVGTLLALALNPVVNAVQRTIRGKRLPAVAIVLAGFAAALMLMVGLLVPPAVRQANDLQRELPRVVTQLNDLPIVGHRLEKAHSADKAQKWIEQLPKRLSGDTAPIKRAGRVVFDGLLASSITLLIAVTLLLDGERLLRAVARLIPVRHRERAERAGDLAYQVVGQYVAGSLALAAVAGLTVLIAGLVLGVPLTPLIAVVVAVFDLVPQIGGAVGGIPFVLLGFTKGAGTAVACAVVFMIFQQVKHNILQPVLVGQAVKLSPPATMTAALIGVSAAGVVGALVAVPLVGAAKAIYLEIRPPVPAAPASTSS